VMRSERKKWKRNKRKEKQDDEKRRGIGESKRETIGCYRQIKIWLYLHNITHKTSNNATTLDKNIVIMIPATVPVNHPIVILKTNAIYVQLIMSFQFSCVF